jgi:CRP-like cAMP-binding protein
VAHGLQPVRAPQIIGSLIGGDPMTTMLESIRKNIARHVALSEAEFELFASLLQHRHLDKKASLLAAGQVCRFEGYVVSGCLRVYHTDPNGNEHVLYFAPEDWWVADIESFTSASPAMLSVDALESSEVLLIDRVSKERLYTKVPKFERLFRIMTQRALVALQDRMIATMRQTADLRYVDFKRRYPNLEHRVPQHQVAAYLGISPEFLSRIRHRHHPRAQPAPLDLRQ